MIGIGVIGYGYWGPNLVRNFMAQPDCRVVMVSDLRPGRLAAVRRASPSVAVTQDYRELLRNPDIHGVAIATPVGSHAALAMEALAAGKHILVEKPLTDNSDDAKRLVDEAARRNLTLMVDHTFVYMGAVRKIHDLVSSGELGDLYYYDSTRVNLGLFQCDVNVFWDLAVHDLSIMDYILPEKPVRVAATGIRNVPGRPENLGYLTVFYDSPLIAHINVNWLSPVKLRQTLISGTRKMVVFDDLHPSEKIKIYDSGITMECGSDDAYAISIGYRTGDMLAPCYDRTEALARETGHFLECLRGQATPFTSGEMGLRIVRILEAANRSLEQGGSPVPLGDSI
ncbi:MAG: Gfo/Idh/MocA family protein [Solidesulfovibrio sp. DCME]|uniref:Gfo/Idh/MocA family protein n=1 Tax=Solidesulfovibrio sp. DCME TaxID=3447380 RepID=UPI003D14EFE6